MGFVKMNIVHLCDCMEYMSGVPDKYYELAIVDPPYGISLEGKNVIKNKSDSNRIFNTDWDIAPPSKEYFDELSRVSKNQIIWGGNYFLDILGYCKAPIIWDKLNGDSLYADGEMAWTSRGLPRNLRIWKHQWCGAFKASERGAEKIHPTQKPVALYKWLLKNYAKPNDKIFDSHVGSGSIRIACHDMGFDFEGCEIDKDYWEAQEERYQMHAMQQDLFSREELQEITYSDGVLI
jgi:site-specific DNA-methyltransferase (adenine-specific)